MWAGLQLGFGRIRVRLAVLLIAATQLHAVTPQALRAHVSFLASDLLEGRDTPSHGLDVAAEYITSQFRSAGLEVQHQVTPWHVLCNGRLPPPFQFACGFEPSLVRNVIAVIPGTGDEYVLVTSHYDHVGTKPDVSGDRIWNGANDNASSVAAMIEIARDLRARRPRRSTVFIAYFGEEKGLWGSRYYARHPLFPVDKTVAQINMEQLGRTDDTEGARVGAAVVSGYDRSNVGAILASAALPLGVKIVKHEKYGEKFFYSSDNEALSKLGVPAHTVAVSFMFPDYHKPGDEWQKLHYENMALITKAITAGVWSIANRLEPPTLLGAPREASDPVSGSSPATLRRKRSTPSPKSQPR